MPKRKKGDYIEKRAVKKERCIEQDQDATKKLAQDILKQKDLFKSMFKPKTGAVKRKSISPVLKECSDTLMHLPLPPRLPLNKCEDSSTPPKPIGSPELATCTLDHAQQAIQEPLQTQTHEPFQENIQQPTQDPFNDCEQENILDLFSDMGSECGEVDLEVLFSLPGMEDCLVDKFEQHESTGSEEALYFWRDSILAGKLWAIYLFADDYIRRSALRFRGLKEDLFLTHTPSLVWNRLWGEESEEELPKWSELYTLLKRHVRIFPASKTAYLKSPDGSNWAFMGSRADQDDLHICAPMSLGNQQFLPGNQLQDVWGESVPIDACDASVLTARSQTQSSTAKCIIVNEHVVVGPITYLLAGCEGCSNVTTQKVSGDWESCVITKPTAPFEVLTRAVGGVMGEFQPLQCSKCMQLT